MAERKSTSQRVEEGGVTTAPGAKMKRITNEELVRLRNEVPMSIVLEGLGVAERPRRRRREFACPHCGGLHLAIHPRENLARCFRCAKSFNPIDLVIAVCGVRFLEAVAAVQGFAAGESPGKIERGRHSGEVAKMNTLG